jgi:hypothetical protein
MRIHRSAHQRFFTTLSNEVLRDSRLSFCARGILAHLLSQPDGKRDDILTLAKRTPEGRERVASAMRELEQCGYVKRTKMRTPEGRIYTEVDVFESPQGPSPSTQTQVTPSTGFPVAGDLTVGADADHPVNEREEEPTRPAPFVEETEAGRVGADDAETVRSTELLARVARAEPRLSLGRAEALRLASLVSEWRRRGASDLHVISALTAGLPREGVHHPARFIESRLRTKMPIERCGAPISYECDECGVPVLAPGLCHTCRDVEPGDARRGADLVEVCARGVAMARAALRGLSFDQAALAET